MGCHLQKPLKNVRFRPISAPAPWNACPMKCLNVSNIYLGQSLFHQGESDFSGVSFKFLSASDRSILELLQIVSTLIELKPALVRFVIYIDGPCIILNLTF